MDLSVTFWGFLGGSVVKNLPAGDMGLIPGSGRSPGEGNGNPLHFFCLRSLVAYSPRSLKESYTTWQLNNNNMDLVQCYIWKWLYSEN